MTLDEAIERNRVVVDKLIDQSWPFDAKAVLIGIEALKRIKALRRAEPPFVTAEDRLEGETYIPESVGVLPSDGRQS